MAESFVSTLKAEMPDRLFPNQGSGEDDGYLRLYRGLLQPHQEALLDRVHESG